MFKMAWGKQDPQHARYKKKNDEDHLDSDYEVQCKSENWL